MRHYGAVICVLCLPFVLLMGGIELARAAAPVRVYIPSEAEFVCAYVKETGVWSCAERWKIERFILTNAAEDAW